MSSIVDSSVSIQISSQSAPSIPSWFGEITLMAHYLRRVGVLAAIEERVRFARRRFGWYEVIDFVAILIGYTISGERTLEDFYDRLLPFALPFMSLFGRDRLPARSTLSRFLAAFDQVAVEALRSLFLEDVLARPRTDELSGGLWDRCGGQWLVFDVDGTRQAARQRALPKTSDRPAPQRRLRGICEPGYTGRKRGEIVRTRTTVLQAHTHQWLGTFGGAGNGDYRGELRRAVETIQSYLKVAGLPAERALIRLDGHYGNGAVVADLAGLPYVMRGKDYQILDQAEVQARLQLPPDQQTIHPESSTTRLLYDCPGLIIGPTGERSRVVIATHPAAGTAKSSVGTTRAGLVYELFFTALPQGAFTAADVVALYLHRGAFETVLADEDLEQDPDRWCSHSAAGQECWQIISHWAWNLRLDLGHQLHPAQVRTTEFAPADMSPPPMTKSPMPRLPNSDTPSVVPRSRMGCLPGSVFPLQPDGTLRCPAGYPLSEQERREERNGTLRIVYAASITHCRPCPLREQCQGYGASTKKPRRVSALLHPRADPARQVEASTPLSGTAPLLWRDWSRCQTRREWMRLLRSQRLDLQVGPPPKVPPPQEPSLLSRAQRAHWRLSWAERLARNARAPTTSAVTITLFGLPPAFAASLGLSSV